MHHRYFSVRATATTGLLLIQLTVCGQVADTISVIAPSETEAESLGTKADRGKKGVRGSALPHAHQLSVVTENDYYVGQGTDRYYSNGFLLQFTRAGKSKHASIVKRVHKYEVGQKMFTPPRKIKSANEIDRPITGYLYGQYTSSYFTKKEAMIQWSASIGLIGEASLAEGLQNMVHELLTIDTEKWKWEWDYQLNSGVGFNVQGIYAKGWLKKWLKYAELTTVSQVALGTDFSHVAQGAVIQIGKFNEMSRGTYWNASVDRNEAPGYEVFFYYHPELMLQIYNSTIQGAVYLKDKGPITDGVNLLVMRHQMGVAMAYRRYSLRLEVVFQGREAKKQIDAHSYGGIHLAYRFL